MSRIAFADESGLDPKTHCYAIGVLSFDEAYLERFVRAFLRLKSEHKVPNELKWKKIDSSHGMINLAIAWLHLILHSRSASFDAIVVDTGAYRKWSERSADRDEAFYTTYTLLLKYIAERSPITKVLIDDRCTRYPKHHEVVKKIANNMLSRLSDQGRLDDVTKVNSSDVPGVQVADLLTGAVAASHRLYLKPDMELNAGKRLTIARLASLLGWDDLCYDTHPNTKFNVWHFPKEFRANPRTRDVGKISAPRYVDGGMLRVVRSAVPRDHLRPRHVTSPRSQ